ncbi:Hypothetical_protein [Hexamita inflata]|uniref:Hypothetical_protein n=1 Tax=Hexamita inflata TaxID=28002 RepID=A0AA86U1T8_9EUKA|nr:Hypothetical protein HINF_LOCUS22682 [Hexamita inflata]
MIGKLFRKNRLFLQRLISENINTLFITNLCFECSYYDKLAVFGSSQCQCGTGFGVTGVFPNCGCLSGFVQVGQLCECYGTISSDGQRCTQRCESPSNTVGCSSCEFGNSKTQFFKD